MPNPIAQLPRISRAKARRIIKRKRGLMTRIAEDAKVTRSVVTEWFDGRNDNVDVSRIVNERLIALLAEEAEKASQPEPICA